MTTINTLIGIAIKNNDFTFMCDIKEACDQLHEGIVETVTLAYQDKTYTYSASALPSDAIYEMLVKKINTLIAMQSLEATKVTHKPDTSGYFMGSIPKTDILIPMEKVLLMPKYDGCSCGMTFSRGKDGFFDLEEARTRGTKETKAGTAKRNYQIITEKVKPLVVDLLHAFNSKELAEYKFEHGQWNDVREIIIRGEIVCKTVEDAEGSPPASVVAGKLNGGHEVWFEFIPKMTMKPFEIVSIITRNVFTVTQYEMFKFFNAAGLPQIVRGLKAVDESQACLNVIESFFDNKFGKAVAEPIDGVVYCSADWKYPFDKKDNGMSNYGKYAWKPSNEGVTHIKEIVPITSKDGAIEYTIVYTPLSMNNKTFMKCKCVPTTIQRFGENFGIGSIITIKLSKDISPMIDTCVAPEDDENFTPFVFPERCPFCGEALNVVRKKDSLRMFCPNELCTPKLTKLCLSVLQTLGCKGVAEGTINKYFDSCSNAADRTAFKLFTDPRSKAAKAIASVVPNMTVKQFFICIYPSYRSEKQMNNVLSTYECEEFSMHPLSAHNALYRNFEHRMSDANETFAVHMASVFAHYLH
jgi:hypothetical protein